MGVGGGTIAWNGQHAITSNELLYSPLLPVQLPLVTQQPLLQLPDSLIVFVDLENEKLEPTLQHILTPTPHLLEGVHPLGAGRRNGRLERRGDREGAVEAMVGAVCLAHWLALYELYRNKGNRGTGCGEFGRENILRRGGGGNN